MFCFVESIGVIELNSTFDGEGKPNITIFCKGYDPQVCIVLLESYERDVAIRCC